LRLVVIGGVAAGLSAAARARRLNPSLEIVVFEKESTVSYGACGLPYFLSGEVRRLDDLIVHTPEYFRTNRNFDVRTCSEVTAIEHGRRQVILASGERVNYDKLVIATGARPNFGNLKGTGEAHVFALHTIEDAGRIAEFLATRKPRSAAVIGAGYIGLEAAEALRTRGLRVRVIDANSNVLGRDDESLTKLVQKHLEVFGIPLECGVKVDQLVSLDDDIVLLATGLKPNVELAVAAGIELGRTGAIQVTDRMETNLGAVYAAGDCAEAQHRITGRPTYVPLGTTANKMGRVAGANAAGRRERLEGIVGTAVVRVCGLGIGLTGLSVSQARREGFDPVSARIESRDRAAYFRGRPTAVELVADRRTRRLIGGTVTGEQGVLGRVDVLATALTAGMLLDDFVDLDLAYAPPYAPVWDPLLVAGQQLIKLLDSQQAGRL
jgi:NADPH-dependent 2,4-dienoyl-CoA reductase/sulfur reductase-like enzyme